ncbi:MAG: molecular chaperone HtpG [Planctomycetota bacterium]
MADAATVESHSFQAETQSLLNLVINSLYTHKEVFLRELVSNASDALDKARIRALTEHALLGEDKDLQIWITADEQHKTLTISDNGVGMTHDELKDHLGTIAKSGSKAFAEALSGDTRKDANLIGQFGVGFYSSFLVADRVEVVSRAALSDEAWRWESEAKGSFTLQPGERDRRGTDVILHLRDDQGEFLEGYRLSSLIKKYSDFVGHPIKVVRQEQQGEGEEAETSTVTETVNQGKALWTRSKAEITDEQYETFYKHVSHDWEPPLARTHFTIEGTQLFTGLLFLPSHPPFDLYMREYRSGVRLYVKRVFVMDECDALLPEYLRFVKGIVDSDDLPLNVSREVLQADRLVGRIRKQVSKKVLEMLTDLADEKPADYDKFWDGFGKVLKEGLHSDPEHKDKLAKLLRFHSSAQEGWTGLDGYVERMKEGQEKIYFISGPDREFLAKSPHIEGLKARGYEVLFFTDAVDEWVAMGLTEYEGKPLVSAMKGEIQLDGAKDEQATQALGGLCGTMKGILGDRVQDVRLTDRLTDSPVCLVSGEHDPGANLERILKAAGAENGMYGGKRVLELNAKHPLIESLQALVGKPEHHTRLRDWTELLHDQALLTEGSKIADPAGFAQRMNSLLLQVSRSLAGAAPAGEGEAEAASEGEATAVE